MIQPRPKPTFLRRLHPITKLWMSLGLTLAIILFANTWFSLLLMLVGVLWIYQGKVYPGVQDRGVRHRHHGHQHVPHQRHAEPGERLHEGSRVHPSLAGLEVLRRRADVRAGRVPPDRPADGRAVPAVSDDQ